MVLRKNIEKSHLEMGECLVSFSDAQYDEQMESLVPQFVHCVVVIVHL